MPYSECPFGCKNAIVCETINSYMRTPLLKMSSRALAVLSEDCAKGMGFASCITTDELSREGSNSAQADFD
jgi:hypothetical protein